MAWPSMAMPLTSRRSNRAQERRLTAATRTSSSACSALKTNRRHHRDVGSASKAADNLATPSVSACWTPTSQDWVFPSASRTGSAGTDRETLALRGRLIIVESGTHERHPETRTARISALPATNTSSCVQASVSGEVTVRCEPPDRWSPSRSVREIAPSSSSCSGLILSSTRCRTC
jgi:hypothetical protein